MFTRLLPLLWDRISALGMKPMLPRCPRSATAMWMRLVGAAVPESIRQFSPLTLQNAVSNTLDPCQVGKARRQQQGWGARDRPGQPRPSDDSGQPPKPSEAPARPPRPAPAGDPQSRAQPLLDTSGSCCGVRRQPAALSALRRTPARNSFAPDATAWVRKRRLLCGSRCVLDRPANARKCQKKLQWYLSN